MYHSFKDCKKFNYRNGLEKNVELSINRNTITYYNRSKKTHININNIIGISYGPKTHTFTLVKKCKPWLTMSFILKNRTYDFQVEKFMNIITIRNIIKKFYPNCYIETADFINKKFKKMLHKDKDPNQNYKEWLNYIIDSNNNLIPFNIECPICLDVITKNDNFILKCRHNYHEECIKMVTDKKCPMCRVIYI